MSGNGCDHDWWQEKNDIAEQEAHEHGECGDDCPYCEEEKMIKKKLKKKFEYAVIQKGYALFGLGMTVDEAIQDATEWMESPEGGRHMTVKEVEDILAVSWPTALVGEFAILKRSDAPAEFDDYAKHQGEL